MSAGSDHAIAVSSVKCSDAPPACERSGIKDIRGDTSDFKYGKGQVVGSTLEMVTMPANMSNPMEKGGKNHKIQGAFL